MLLITSCEFERKDKCTTSVKVIYDNKSPDKNHFVLSTGSDSIVFNQNPGSQRIGLLCFTLTKKVDGQYFVKLKTPSKDTTFYWGYFSNGIPSEKSITITFNGDSLKMLSEF